MQPKHICLLTGATGGIGQAIAQLFDAQGFQLILHGRNELKLETLQKSLKGNHHIICGDLNDAEVRRVLIDEAFADLAHQPTMLINNAGISQFKSFDEIHGDDIESLISTNLIATIDFTRLFLCRVKESSTIVNVGSAYGAIGYPGYSLYCASKFGLRGFTEALMRELANSDHRVCYFAPRATNTSINSTSVQRMNSELGNNSDTPEFVAQELLTLINSKSARKTVGWPEKFFARINGVLPEVVDKSIIKQTKEILTFARGEQ
ncbi:SDR family oxidoreductase [Thalassotalea piscium]|uniref:Short-subunit dehydrogenase n=1 Tax=Thalassotalea piscium TaxID=1230533 RepID=A0A7X0NDY9_9GAMM|nr:SDR family oxidoreductase [Thalassotalea piscium]MBB6541675.1 short-subunit dehydrogenase [Thalassotalea piscium]